MKIKVSKGQKIKCPHCGAVVADCPKEFEFNHNHSFEGTLARLGFSYHTVDWFPDSRMVECMACGNQFDVFARVLEALEK